MANSFIQDVTGATRASVADARKAITDITGTMNPDGTRNGGVRLDDPLNGFMLQEKAAGLNAALGAGSAIVKKNTDGNDNVIANLR